MTVKLVGPAQYPMVRIPAGSFWMGARDDEPNRYDNERPRHEVTVAEFWMGIAPVTQAQWQRFVYATPGHPSECPVHKQAEGYVAGPDRPKVCVTWDQAESFAAWLGLTLPTEAQWEYACRAGTTTLYWSGDTEADLDRVGWFGGNSLSGSQPVCQKPANSFGLHDMHGNVLEWCQDWWDERAYEKPVRPGDGLRELPSGEAHVLRGGGWNYSARVAAASARTYNGLPEFPFLGFRCVTPLGKSFP